MQTETKSLAKRNTGKILWLILLFVMAIFLLWFFVFRGIVGTSTFPTGSYLGRVDVSQMKPENATQAVASTLTSGDTEAEIVLTSGEKSYSWKGSDFEVLTETQKLVEKSHRIARQNTRQARLETLKEIKEMGIKEPLPIRLVLAGLTEKIEEACLKEEKEPIEAKVVFNADSTFDITPPVAGKKINKALLISQIDSAFEKSNKVSLEIPFDEIPAKETLSSVKQRLKLRSSFSTSFDEPSSGRGKNISLALKKINGTVINPGESFSFNSLVGCPSGENGFFKANIIMNGEFVKEYGGGLCQASTTVYNAALLAGLEISESHCHSLQVGYVRAGFDAMVTYNSNDMRFVNNQSYPIYIASRTIGTEAIAEIYGKPLEEGKKIDRRSVIVKKNAPKGDKIVADEAGEYSNYVIYKGEFHRIKQPKDGLEAEAYLDTYVDGKLISSKLLRKSRYAPIQGILVEGTEELPEYLALPTKII
ncbi:MAG: VanW family protein [Clostridia bacterium]